jgi:hypothetical protein
MSKESILLSEATQDARQLAETYLRDGYDECLGKLRGIVKSKKLTTVERLVLVERTRNAVMSAGYSFRKPRHPILRTTIKG